MTHIFFQNRHVNQSQIPNETDFGKLPKTFYDQDTF